MVIGQMERPLFRLVIKIIPAGGATSAKQLLLMAVHRPNMIGIDPYSHVRTHTYIYTIYQNVLNLKLDGMPVYILSKKNINI